MVAKARILVLFVSVLALAGCTSTVSPPAPSDPAPAAAGAEEAATDAPTSEPPAAGLSDCLVGSWVLPEEQLIMFYAAAASGIPELAIDPFGTIGLEFAPDGGYTYLPDFGFVLTLDVAGLQLQPRAVVAGQVTGTWSVEEETLLLGDVNSSLAIDAEYNGQPLDITATTDALIEASPMLTPPGAVTCTPDTLLIPVDADTGGIVEVLWSRT